MKKVWVTIGILCLVIIASLAYSPIETFESSLMGSSYNGLPIGSPNTYNGGLDIWSNEVGISRENHSLNHFIDVIYYINLDERTDRKEQFLAEMDKINFSKNKIIRIAGTKTENGHIGCSLSHIKAVSEFIASGKLNCIIFEDDFEFTADPIHIKHAFSDFIANHVQYDICMLSGNVVEQEMSHKYYFLNKILNAQTASGYMLNRNFAETLLENFNAGSSLLSQNPKDHPKYAIDQYWKVLQPKSRWYIFNPKLGKQRNSYSNIQGGYLEMVV